MDGGWVYVMADRYRGTMYIGVTSNIAARVWAHRELRLQLLRPLWADAAGLRRAGPNYRGGNCPREGGQEMEPGLEDRADRKRQSRLE
jgi:hypothetical protein